MSENETALQIIWRHHFLQSLLEAREAVAHRWSLVKGMSQHFRILQKLYTVFPTAPTPSVVQYIAHTPRSVHTFDLKQQTKKEFNKRPSEKIKLVAVLEDQTFFANNY
jgi:hypothetical protein